MTIGNTLLLARSGIGRERARLWLVAGSVAAAGALVLVAVRLVTLGPSGVSPGGFTGGRFIPYVADAGTRPGVVLAAVLLAVPVLALTWQGIRSGSATRDRRMAALRLGGATPGQVRRLAAAEAGAAAALGGVLALPGYLTLWLVLGLLPPAGAAIVPGPVPADLGVWLVLLLLFGCAGAGAGAVVHRDVIVDPLGLRRRARRSVSRPAVLTAAGVGLAVLAGVRFLPLSFGSGALGVLQLGVVLLVLLGVAMVLAGSAVSRMARRRRSSAQPADVLSGALLSGDPRTPGRLAGVLWFCGLGLGIATNLVVDLLARQAGMNLDYYLGGTALAVLVMLTAAAVAVGALGVGAAEQLRDARRPLSSLTALGVEPAVLRQALHRTLTAVASPAVGSGVIVGGLFFYLIIDQVPAVVLLAFAAVAVLAAAAMRLAGRVVVRVLATRLREATDPENLRAP